MPDILANGEFGRDDGIKCHACGGPTFLTDDQGDGLRGYDCKSEGCDEVTQVQFDIDEDTEYEPEGWEEAFFEEQTGQRGIPR